MASAAVGEGDATSKYLTNAGPQDGIKYPLKVIYCGECSLPPEYCEFGSNYEKCKEWLQENLPEEFSAMMLIKDGKDDDGDEKKKRQTRGGKGKIKPKKKAEPKQICISTASRGKKKYMTVITGLATYDIDLKKASKKFGSRFACGSSVTGPDEIVIQGDCKDDLWDFIPDTWPEIDEDSIDDLGEQKRS